MQGAETTNVHPGLRIQDHEQGTLRSVCLAVDSRRVTLTRAEKGSTRRDRPTRQLVRRTTYQVVRGQLRTGRRIRKSRWLTRTGHGPTIANKTMIDQRPASAETKLEAGHWEGDMIIGVGSASAMVTLRERTTQYGVIVNLP